MKRVMCLLILIWMISTRTTAQDFYSFTTPGFVRQFQPGLVNLVQVAPKKMLVVVPGQVVAEVDDAKGQAAVDDCTAGRVAPLPGPAGTGANCENNRQPAINADVLARFKTAFSQ